MLNLIAGLYRALEAIPEGLGKILNISADFVNDNLFWVSVFVTMLSFLLGYVMRIRDAKRERREDELARYESAKSLTDSGDGLVDAMNDYVDGVQHQADFAYITDDDTFIDILQTTIAENFASGKMKVRYSLGSAWMTYISKNQTVSVGTDADMCDIVLPLKPNKAPGRWIVFKQVESGSGFMIELEPQAPSCRINGKRYRLKALTAKAPRLYANIQISGAFLSVNYEP